MYIFTSKWATHDQWNGPKNPIPSKKYGKNKKGMIVKQSLKGLSHEIDILP
jgi:hypothetical protein